MVESKLEAENIHHFLFKYFSNPLFSFLIQFFQMIFAKFLSDLIIHLIKPW